MTEGKIAVVLSGCGVFDGSEVHETSAACAAITRAGKKVAFYAPDKDHHHQVNHLTGASEPSTTRNVRIEACRIARGEVKPLSELQTDAVDAVIFPGGFGAAKNLSSFATSAEPAVDEDVARVIREFVAAGKPLGLCCIAPILVALVLCKEDGVKVKMTLGKRTGEGWPYAATIDKAIEFGADHHEMNVDEICIDEEHKIVTTPAFMFDAEFHQVQDGVGRMVETVVGML